MISSAAQLLARHRRFTGLISIGIAVVTLWLLYWAVDVADAMKFDPPTWLAWVLGLGFVVAVFSELMAIVWGIHDLARHFLPEGPFKESVLQAARPKWDTGQGRPMNAEEIARESLNAAMFPVWVILALAGIGAAILLLMGGATVVHEILQRVFAGWPPWAVVICFLLLALLFKEEKK